MSTAARPVGAAAAVPPATHSSVTRLPSRLHVTPYHEHTGADVFHRELLRHCGPPVALYRSTRANRSRGTTSALAAAATAAVAAAYMSKMRASRHIELECVGPRP